MENIKSPWEQGICDCCKKETRVQSMAFDSETDYNYLCQICYYMDYIPNKFPDEDSED